jgi:hypothetical protein
MPLFGSSEIQRAGWAVVYRAQGMLEAEAVKGSLETADIPTVLDYESLGQTLGITIGGLGEVRVLVPTDRADDARELLREPIDDDENDEDAETAAEPD